MITEYEHYNLYLKFFESYSQSGIEGIDPADPIMVELEEFMEMHNQIFYISDVILMDILYVTGRVNTFFGIKPHKVTQGFFLTTTHPDDLHRHHLARAKLVSLAHELYIQKKGQRIISVNVRARKSDGSYFNALYQAQFFYSKVPYESVFLILIITDISWAKNIHKGFHFYSGDDPSFFRYPDHELLMKGNIFSNTEFRIIELINEGLSSKEISEKLYRSLFTINTHRSNIIKKSGKATIGDVVRDLKEQGFL